MECIIQNMYVNTNICICIHILSWSVLYRICMLIQTYVYVYIYSHGVFIQNMYVNTNICICIQLYSHGVYYTEYVC